MGAGEVSGVGESGGGGGGGGLVVCLRGGGWGLRWRGACGRGMREQADE